MTRDQFRNGVFERDAYCCVVPGCTQDAVDAHHVLDRALWLQNDPHPEGYHLHNGASVCEHHHRLCENNAIPPQALRWWLGLPTVLPQQLAPASIWDKWGKEIPRLPNNKYPGTPYLRFSPQIDPKDTVADTDNFLNRPLAVSIKWDGSNVMLTREKVAARNGDQANHPQYDRLKAFHAGIKSVIAPGEVIFAEWLFAKHSIHYTDLPALLQVIAVYVPEHQMFLGVTDTIARAMEIGLDTVFTTRESLNRTYTEGWRFESEIYAFFQKVVDEGHEGIVVRNWHPFHAGVFGENVAKMVRADHNSCPADWKSRPITPNVLRD